MQFNYDNKPTVESAIRQSIGLIASSVGLPTVAVDEMTADLLAEVRSICVGKIQDGIDWEHIAQQWNAGLDYAVEAVQNA